MIAMVVVEVYIVSLTLACYAAVAILSGSLDRRDMMWMRRGLAEMRVRVILCMLLSEFELRLLKEVWGLLSTSPSCCMAV